QTLFQESPPLFLPIFLRLGLRPVYHHPVEHPLWSRAFLFSVRSPCHFLHQYTSFSVCTSSLLSSFSPKNLFTIVARAPSPVILVAVPSVSCIMKSASMSPRATSLNPRMDSRIPSVASTEPPGTPAAPVKMIPRTMMNTTIDVTGGSSPKVINDTVIALMVSVNAAPAECMFAQSGITKL